MIWSRNAQHFRDSVFLDVSEMDLLVKLFFCSKDPSVA